MFQTLTGWLKESSYGKFTSVIRQLFHGDFVEGPVPAPASEEKPTFDLQEVRLPRIIVAGTETSGKSTLLQCIIKRKFFPQNFELCTKCPIVLRLQESKDNKHVVTWLGERYEYTSDKEVAERVQIVTDGLESQVDDELIIEISGPDLPNFELIDLPGLIAVPGDARDKVESIVDRYIADKDTLVLCVVPGTTTRLTGNLAVAKVIKSEKQSQCILCLTMCDTVTSRFDNLIGRRVLMGEEMQKLSPIPFAGVVATAHLDSDDNANEERDFFDKIFKHLDADSQLLREELKAHLMSTNVIRMLDGLFHGYITNTWCPNLLEKIQVLIDQETTALSALGRPPAELTVLELWTEVRRHLVEKEQAVYDALSIAVREAFHTLFAPLLEVPGFVTASSSVNPSAAMTTERVHAVRKCREVLENAASLFAGRTPQENRQESAASTSNTTSPLRALMIQTLWDKVDEVFAEESDTTLKLARFPTLNELLKAGLRGKCIDLALQETDAHCFYAKLQMTLANLSKNEGTLQSLLQELENHAVMIFSVSAGTVLSHFDEYVAQHLLLHDTALDETPTVAAARTYHVEQLSLLRERFQNIENLQDFVKPALSTNEQRGPTDEYVMAAEDPVR